MIQLATLERRPILPKFPPPIAQATPDEVVLKIGRAFVRTILVLPILYDITKAGFHWLAGKLILPASFNFTALQAAMVMAMCLLFPITLYSSFSEETSSPALKMLLTLIYIVLFPLGIHRIYQQCKKVSAFFNQGTKAHLAEERQKLLENPACERVTFETRDGCKLDGMLYVPNGANRNKLLLYANANAAFYEHRMPTQIARADRFKLPILLFNPRGVGESSGSPSAQGLGLDVEAAYEFGMRKLGIKAGDILAYGHSLGGAAAAQGAALIQERYPDQEISIVNDRSFANLEACVHHMFGKGRIAKIACAILRWTGWELDSEKALGKLKGQKLIICLPEGEDHVIRHEASLGQALVQRPQENARLFQLKRNVDESAHIRGYEEFETIFIKNSVRNILGLEDMIFPKSYDGGELQRNYLNECLGDMGIARIKRLSDEKFA